MSGHRILVTVNPANIKQAVIRRDKADKIRFFSSGIGLPPPVFRGDWDLRTIPIWEHPTYRLMADFVENGFVTEACYDHLVTYYQSKGRRYGAATNKASRKLKGYVDQYWQLYLSLQEKGYQTQKAVDEIGVSIGRDGTLIKDSRGHHRFALAQLLRLEKITAELRFVHRDWLKQGDTRRLSTRVEEAGLELIR